MQYAEVALAVRTATQQPSFTYRVPPGLLPEVQIGQRVKVPFAGRQLIGTILGFRQTVPKIKGQFKEIKRVIEPFPIFDKATIALADKVAQNYAASIGQVLESAAPKPLLRFARQVSIDQSEPKGRAVGASVVGLYEPVEQRYNSYLTLINRAVNKKHQVLILFPTQELSAQFQLWLKEKGIGALVLPSSQPALAHYEAWLIIRGGGVPVVIGTRKAIFLPLANLGLLIIDRVSEYGYKEEQFPYYHSVTVAKLRANLQSSHLVLGDVAPRLAEWSAARTGEIQFAKAARQSTTVTVLDTTTERGLVPNRLLEYIIEAIAKKQLVGLFYNRKGTGRYYRCLVCETAFYCRRCDTLLTVYEEGEKIILRCHACGHSESPDYKCKVCQSYRLGAAGLGIEALATIIQEKLPQARIAIISGDKKNFDSRADIFISTRELFYLPNPPDFDLAVSFLTDQLLHGQQWDTQEQAYLTLAQLKSLTKHLIIQTAEPEHLVIQTLATGRVDRLYQAEWAHRRQHNYPPASPLIRLTIAGSDEDNVKQKADSLYQKYRALLPEADQRLFPPTPIGSGKRRNKYRYQIIIKSSLTRLITNNLPTDWQIDPEPVGFDS